jgi:hypothetical protein
MSIRPLNEDGIPGGQDTLIQRTKFRNPTISDMASSNHILSPVMKNKDDPTIMQFSDMGDDYYEVPENLPDDLRFFMCTCHLKREDLPCTCKFNDVGFNRAMYLKVTTKDEFTFEYISD